MIEVKTKHEEERNKILAELRGDSERRQLSVAHRLGERPWHDDAGLPAHVTLAKEREKRDQKREKMREALKEFREYLWGCYGSEVRAWRKVLDPKGEFKLTRFTLRKLLCSVH